MCSITTYKLSCKYLYQRKTLSLLVSEKRKTWRTQYLLLTRTCIVFHHCYLQEDRRRFGVRVSVFHLSIQFSKHQNIRVTQ